MQKAVRSRVCSEGMALVDEGQSDMEALEALQERAAEFGGMANAVAKHTIDAAVEERAAR